jgi:hypothetical protein
MRQKSNVEEKHRYLLWSISVGTAVQSKGPGEFGEEEVSSRFDNLSKLTGRGWTGEVLRKYLGSHIQGSTP